MTLNNELNAETIKVFVGAIALQLLVCFKIGLVKVSIDSQGENIKQLIFDALSEQTYLTATELKAVTGCLKPDIHSVLYTNRKIFKKSDDYIPKWSLVIISETPDIKILPSRVVKQSRVSLELYEWQKKALKAWIRKGRRGIVEAVTGAGKTRMALAAISDHLNLGGKVAIVVPTIELQAQWRGEVAGYFPELNVGLLGGGSKDSLDNCDLLIAVAKSASMNHLGLPPNVSGLLVADECHRLGSEVFKLSLEDIFEFRLGLTATLERSDGGHDTVLLPYFGPVVYSLNYRRAIDDGIISRFRVATIGVDLRADEKIRYEEWSEQIRVSKRVLVNKFGIRPEPHQKFMEAVQKLAKNGTMQEGMAAGRYLSGLSKRRALLCETPAKLELLALLAPVIKSSHGTFLFTETTNSADEAAHRLRILGVNAESMHSKQSDVKRRSVFKSFSSGTVKAIVAARVLDEGVNVPEADFAVILAATKTRRQMIQRMGRILRPKADGRSARFAITYVHGTVEDPPNRAHDAFFSEILDVADEIANFSTSEGTFGLADFLNP